MMSLDPMSRKDYLKRLASGENFSECMPILYKNEVSFASAICDDEQICAAFEEHAAPGQEVHVAPVDGDGLRIISIRSKAEPFRKKKIDKNAGVWLYGSEPESDKETLVVDEARESVYYLLPNLTIDEIKYCLEEHCGFEPEQMELELKDNMYRLTVG